MSEFLKMTEEESRLAAFISHNKADADAARLLAGALVEQGIDVWFDEWGLHPGDSIVGGIEAGLEGANLFVLIWSEAASTSGWVGKEIAASHYSRRKIRIVPVLLDRTPLPPLLRDYKYRRLDDLASIEAIAEEIAGRPVDKDLAARLQRRLHEVTERNAQQGDPLPFLICPRCSGPNLKRGIESDPAHDETYYWIRCDDCGWSEGIE